MLFGHYLFSFVEQDERTDEMRLLRVRHGETNASFLSFLFLFIRSFISPPQRWIVHSSLLLCSCPVLPCLTRRRPISCSFFLLSKGAPCCFMKGCTRGDIWSFDTHCGVSGRVAYAVFVRWLKLSLVEWGQTPDGWLRRPDFTTHLVVLRKGR